MSTFKERLLVEKQELDDKKSKLDNFIGGDIFPTTDTIQQSLLLIQSQIMGAYSQCLQERIVWLEKEVTSN